MTICEICTITDIIAEATHTCEICGFDICDNESNHILDHGRIDDAETLSWGCAHLDVTMVRNDNRK